MRIGPSRADGGPAYLRFGRWLIRPSYIIVERIRQVVIACLLFAYDDVFSLKTP